MPRFSPGENHLREKEKKTGTPSGIRPSHVSVLIISQGEPVKTLSLDTCGVKNVSLLRSIANGGSSRFLISDNWSSLKISASIIKKAILAPTDVPALPFAN